jgi:phosphoserine phosphatase
MPRMNAPEFGRRVLMGNDIEHPNGSAGDSTDTILVLVRHGQTVWNSQGRWQGWLDSPLTEQGEREARYAADELRDMKIDRILCSDMGRAVRTAEILSMPFDLDPEITEHLRERFYGEYEGLNAAEIAERLPGTRYDPTRDDRETYRPPGGETMAEVRERIDRYLRRLVGEHPGKTLLLVTHSGVVRAVDSICQARTFDEIWGRVPYNACIFVVRVNQDGRFSVETDFYPTMQPA